MFPPRWQAAWRWGAPALTLAALLLLVWNCAFNPEIRFLTPGPSQWIVYPLPAAGHSYPGFELAGTFRRAFALPEKPAAALLCWRAMTNAEVRVNNTLIPPPAASGGNWKSTSQAEVGSFLRPGSNEISVTVVNGLGPPALSLELKAGSFRLASDESWEVSVSGSDWRAAQAASATPRAGKGNDLSLLETTNGALQRCWPSLCLFAVISAGAVALLQYYSCRVISLPAWRRSRVDWRQQLHFYVGRVISSSPSVLSKRLLLLLAVAWATLFLHNLLLGPLVSGSDAAERPAYGSGVQDYGTQPPAQEGFETFQPPLYNFISSNLLDVCNCTASQPAGMILLRCLGLAIGAVTLALVFTGLRLIFPGDWTKPLIGLVLAAFLPAHLCLLHYTGNETLAALFVTAALCVGVHVLQGGRVWWGWYGVLGIVLGLALSSKASAALAVLAILGALAVKLVLRRESTLRLWMGWVGAPLLLCLLVGGWHYLKLWGEYGSPFIGSLEMKLGAPWWQAKGFQTPGYYCSFGSALARPFLSGLHSFWDGFYSTLWGDGLLGGRPLLWNRPPWNYDLMAVGFVLALVPTALVLTGLARAIARTFHEANFVRLLLNGLGWLFAFAIVDMALKVPSYSQIKASYGLPVLLPFCAMGALGFEYWASRGKLVRFVLGTVLGVWLLNVYASFWIRPGTAQTDLSSAAATALNPRWDPSEAIWKAEHHHSSNSLAMVWLSQLEAQTDPAQAVRRLEQALKHDPANGQIEAHLAEDLALCDRLDEAVVHAKRAVELAPEDEFAAQEACLVEFRHKNYQEAVAAGRHALSLNPADVVIHSQMGQALMNLRQMPEAITHFSAVVKANPGWAEARFDLGLCLLDQPGQWDNGLSQLKEAVNLNPTNTAWQAALENALKKR